MKILVSACLLGEPCRYDGESRPCDHIIKLKEKHTLIPVCPEVLGGLPTPRPASEIQADGRLENVCGEDVTDEYRRGAETVLAIAREQWASVAILKEKSPACGKGRVYDGSFTRTLREGNGVCAALLLENGIRVFGESEIDAIEHL